jgi:hypothetical protein
MEIALVAFVALFASTLTFFSGFGLGTMLTAVFILFFPVDLAIALTAIVHFLNNVFKFIVIGKNTSWPITWKFGIPAIAGAAIGAALMLSIDTQTSWYTYSIGSITAHIEPLKLLIAVLMILFALAELTTVFKMVEFKSKQLIAGGLLSGFFGGLSGHQGALRSLFLIQCGLQKEAFVATGVSIALLIDVSRLVVYSKELLTPELLQYKVLVATAIVAALAGVLIGKRLLTKVTIRTVQLVVSTMVILLGILLGMGIL